MVVSVISRFCAEWRQIVTVRNYAPHRPLLFLTARLSGFLVSKNISVKIVLLFLSGVGLEMGLMPEMKRHVKCKVTQSRGLFQRGLHAVHLCARRGNS